MDNDSIEGTVKQATGDARSIAGNLTNNQGLAVEGETNNAVGKIQSALGSLKEKLQKKQRRVAAYGLLDM